MNGLSLLIFTSPPAQCSRHKQLFLENPPGYFKKRKREKQNEWEIHKKRIMTFMPFSTNYLYPHCVYLFIALTLIMNCVNVNATSTIEDDLKVLSLSTTTTTESTLLHYNNSQSKLDISF